MTLVYVAGPYSAETPEEVESNVRRAIRMANSIKELGYQVYCPHLSHYLDVERHRPYEDWIQDGLAWVERCDAVYRLPGESKGADRETALAASRGIPVCYSKGKLVDAIVRKREETTPQRVEITPPSVIAKDAGKTPWHLLAWDVIEEVALVMAYGADKHSLDDWKTVSKEDVAWVYFDKTLRHIKAAFKGEEIDLESKKPHITCAIADLVIWRWHEKQQDPAIGNWPVPLHAETGEPLSGEQLCEFAKIMEKRGMP